MRNEEQDKERNGKNDSLRHYSIKGYREQQD
jgi:hypothetical protein